MDGLMDFSSDYEDIFKGSLKRLKEMFEGGQSLDKIWFVHGDCLRWIFDELEGVIGHELSHIKHNDILISTMAVRMEKLSRASQKIPMDANPATALTGGFSG